MTQSFGENRALGPDEKLDNALFCGSGAVSKRVA